MGSRDMGAKGMAEATRLRRSMRHAAKASGSKSKRAQGVASRKVMALHAVGIEPVYILF
jgi:hypothetical protein